MKQNISVLPDVSYKCTGRENNIHHRLITLTLVFQELLPVSEKLADLITEVPEVPELKTETVCLTILYKQ